ncbi:MAG TPA: glutamate 5-kinase [Acidimicrobiia bacterium]|nr:glutamate 5-kinase [Acidimicrobiia bacterium]
MTPRAVVRAVVKVGTSSLTDERGELDSAALTKLCEEIADARDEGHVVALVSSGAIAAGMPMLGIDRRPTEIGTLQAIAAVGQPRLFGEIATRLAGRGVVAGQVLLDPYDFGHRTQYLHARETLERLFALGVVPVVNENDTVADDEIRYGDNDRLAALVANLVRADVLALLTDTGGLFTADPRLDANASLIEEITAVDAALEAVAGGQGTERGSGGMASKLAAAKIASHSGVRAVIASAGGPDVVRRVLAGETVGTVVHPHPVRLSSRKLWIAFARPAEGAIRVDAGARAALVEDGRSLLPAGVADVSGEFDADDAVEVIGPDGKPFAKGLVRYGAAALRAAAGRRTTDLPDDAPHEVIHRDDLVVFG